MRRKLTQRVWQTISPRSPREGILSVIGFFVVGGAILAFVDVEEGHRVARSEEVAVGA